MYGALKARNEHLRGFISRLQRLEPNEPYLGRWPRLLHFAPLALENLEYSLMFYDRQECRSYWGKFARGCKVTLFTTMLGSGRSVPSFTGAPIIISAVLIPSITRPNTVYFLLKAGWRFSVM